MRTLTLVILLVALLPGINSCSKKQNAAPTPDFTYTGTLQVGYLVTFHSNVANASAYKWSFGDGSYSTDSAPQHTYATAASFAVTLSINNDSTNKVTKTITIGAALDFTITGTPTVGYALNFSSNAPAGSTYLWNFGDGNAATAATPSHIYPTNGMYIASLEINNDAGHIVQKSLLLFADGIYFGLIPTGAKTWRHITNYSNTVWHTGSVDTLADTTMTINFIFPSSVAIGSDTIPYTSSTNGDSVLVFSHHGSGSYNVENSIYLNRYTLSMKYEKFYFAGSGGTTYDDYYNP